MTTTKNNSRCGRLLPNARQLEVDGVAFPCYRTGFDRYERRSPDGRICIAGNHHTVTYYATVDDIALKNKSGSTKRFRTMESAAREALKLARRTPTV
ncbi:hypothetical protein [Rhodopseudomonas sp. B29]|uniref:hypothetical protein n=1 Tax=Rhodopseudomonas sp. B29 TaxID=95607 RepID=UPI00034B3BF7|nr:hypothetical protein [Rhodopseudomonas sp. B29]